MSRTYNKHGKSWNFPKRIVKEMTKSRARSIERQAIIQFEKGEIDDINLGRWQDVDDIWNYD